MDHDSEITARLKRAGLVIFGKTNTPEMGLASVDGAAALRPDAQSVEPGAQRGRVERRLRRGGRVGHGADGACDRRRRLDSHPRLGVRALRPQADARAQPDGPGRGRGLGRRLGGARRHPDGAGQRRAARRDVRARRGRSVLGAAAGAAVSRRGRARPGAPQDRPHDAAVERAAGGSRVRRGGAGGGARSASGSATTWRRRARTSTRASSARRRWS